jgi:hypothetical protein
MASPYTRGTISAGFGAETAINAELAKIEAAFETVLNKDVSTDNAMDIDLDMNGNDILNAGSLFAGATGLVSGDNVSELVNDAGYVTSAGVSDIVDDTTPQLGGNLDVNGNSIVSTSNADISITPNGTGNVVLGNFEFNVDQVVGASQDGYSLVYDNASGTISLEEVTSGGGGGDTGDLTITGTTISADDGLSPDSVTLVGGSSEDYTYASVAFSTTFVSGADGLSSASGSGSPGGAVTITTGTGGTSTAAAFEGGGNGGTLLIEAGSGGGAETVSPGAGGNGGSVNILSGAGGAGIDAASGGRAGDINIISGAGAGDGVDGEVTISSSSATIVVGDTVDISDSPPIFPDYNVGSLPAAAEYLNGVIIVDNESGGRTLATSNGTNWLRVSDGAIVS